MNSNVRLVRVIFQFNVNPPPQKYTVAVAATEEDWLTDKPVSGVDFHVSQTYN